MIDKGKKVKIHYVLTVEGQEVDSSRDRGPLEYEHGSGQIVPGLERQLEGLKPGDHQDIMVSAEEGYGPVQKENIVEVPRDRLPPDNLEVGSVLSAQGPTGQNFRGVVTELNSEKARVDFNHPLAGKELHFAVDIVEVA